MEARVSSMGGVGTIKNAAEEATNKWVELLLLAVGCVVSAFVLARWLP